jgi:formamidopyrimidine-DNA glycosylase
MPELPEVEFAAGVARAVAVGRTITSIRVLHHAQRRALPARRARLLVGDRVNAVDRRGKTQLFRLTSGRVLAVHFRMTGDWAVRAAGEALPPHARAVFAFDNGVRLVLDDARALAVISMVEPGASAVPGLGPDANDPDFTAAALGAALAARRIPIKLALLDQRVVAGLGNIYVAEALWSAKIDPRTPANRLRSLRLKRLVAAIRRVLAKAARHAQRYYTRGLSAPNRFEVYDREGEPCRRCGARIKRIVQGARSTYFCATCQA